MNPIFSLAPLQGITDYPFRNLFNKHFAGIEKYYSPFIRLQNDGSIKKTQLTDIQHNNNHKIRLIPQIMCNNPNDFIFLANILSDFGYREINWNLGCPYPMVAKRQLGSGLIPFPDKIREILDNSLPQIECEVSIKIRSGYENENEIFDVLPVLSQFPIKELIIHPRIARQMYKGNANPLIVEKCLELYSSEISYNGDIQTIESYLKLKEQFSTIHHWMIGRGLIANPFLAEEIINRKITEPALKLERFSLFHSELFDFYNEKLEGYGHVHIKMLSFWEYFASLFINSHKVYKRIKKANSLEKYNAALHEIFNNEELSN